MDRGRGPGQPLLLVGGQVVGGQLAPQVVEPGLDPLPTDQGQVADQLTIQFLVHNLKIASNSPMQKIVTNLRNFHSITDFHANLVV